MSPGGAACSRRNADDTCVLADPAFTPGERPRRVQADDDNLVVLEDRLEIGGDEALVPGERREEPARHVPQRHVVIAGNHQVWRGEVVEEGARLAELGPGGALRQVAREHHQVRLRVGDGRGERPEDGGIDAAGVKVRKMDNRAQCDRSAEGQPAAGFLPAIDSATDAKSESPQPASMARSNASSAAAAVRSSTPCRRASSAA